MQPVQVQVSLDINGAAVNCLVEPRRTLLDTLRTDLNLTGTKKACDMGDCGACTVLVDGLPMYACLLLAVDCRGRQVTTIEGLGGDHPLQRCFVEHGAAQCGICTPGMILAAVPLPRGVRLPQIREALAGNLCRCTGYAAIYRAVEAAKKKERRR